MRTLAEKPKASQQAASPQAALWTRSSLEHNHAVNSILRLKRTIGSQASQMVQRACVSRGTCSAEQAAAPPIVHEVLQSPGQPLDPATRAFMEPRLGRDLSRVRVHTDGRAAASAQAVNALAYTVGRHLVFGCGQYAPHAGPGRRLLAHELAHAVQQDTVQRSVGPLSIGAPGDRLEREADAASLRSSTVGGLSVTPEAVTLRRMPAVGFVVRSLNRQRGQLDNPMEDGAGGVSFPLSFAVTSPLVARAEVEVTGAAGDPCASFEVGWLQTVVTQWLHVYYWGRHAGDGSTILRFTVSVPIRDGDPATFWYDPSGNGRPAGCGSNVPVRMDDYPTIFMLAKARQNSSTGQLNYLTGIRRGISFVTTLVAMSATQTHPLRHFHWNYQMSIDFRPNYASLTAVWPFTWNKNTANLDRVYSGKSASVPMFTTATVPYNQALVPNVTERT